MISKVINDISINIKVGIVPVFYWNYSPAFKDYINEEGTVEVYHNRLTHNIDNYIPDTKIDVDGTSWWITPFALDVVGDIKSITDVSNIKEDMNVLVCKYMYEAMIHKMWNYVAYNISGVYINEIETVKQHKQMLGKVFKIQSIICTRHDPSYILYGLNSDKGIIYFPPCCLSVDYMPNYEPRKLIRE